ncbi:MAG: hypothetical protein AVDCRST_MAG93-6423 [uncultured Chloroflexia bacterium]|uniref:Uncharacterized protein n=1 Tax=uncultured Chloroflexia bacterium TaxID=1672391 RepID=A0A6J4LKL4_9CHLR|nr:MAG: hypothetical protein AVDCRST_MAG93-6423 [uncultured Chloroflexia bacterium]
MDDLDILPAAKGQTVVVQEVMEGAAIDGNRDALELSEVRQTHLSRRVTHLEHHLLGFAVSRFPLLHSTLKRSELAIVTTGILLLQVLKQGHRFEAGFLFQHRLEF